jgi:ABC-type sugar transport system ATPase subunit
MAVDSSKGEVVMRTEGLSKSYAGVEVLHDFSFDVHAGEVLALVGENGAGKSTILSLITGMTEPTSGTILYKGAPLPHGWSPHVARAAGIGSVHQELSLNPHQTVAENVFLGNWPTRHGFIGQRRLERAAQSFLDEVGLDVSPATAVGRLSLGGMQLVELAKALVCEPDLLVLDEVTSALDDAQVQNVFRVIERLRDAGKSVITVSHRIRELFDVCDRMTVLKDGVFVATRARGETNEEDIVQLMLGRSLSAVFPSKRDAALPAGKPIVAVRDLTVAGACHKVSLDLLPGTITGLGGLQGQGQVEVLRALFGLVVYTGKVEVSGRHVTIRSPRTAIRNRIIFVPDDRKVEGVHVAQSVAANIELPNLPLLAPLSRLGTVSRRRSRNVVADMIARLQIKASPQQEVGRLSGGNQQKVALAKWLPSEPRILLLAEPTRGIDVGTKREIYRLLREFADNGLAVLITSGETLELIGLCDEIVVMYEGRVVQRLIGDDITEEQLVRASVMGSHEVDHVA